MKNIWVTVIFFMLSVFIPAQSLAVQIDVTGMFRASGYFPPVASSNLSDTAYTFLAPSYRAYWGSDHAGTDIDNAEGSSVFSIARGTVLRVSSQTTPAESTLVAIKHMTADGSEFVAIYGHTRPAIGLVAGSTVTVGQRIGDTRKFGNPSHLHFGINTNRDFCSSTGCLAGWGRVPVGNVGTFVNLQTWLPANPATLFPPSIIDGNGSLVDPSSGGECNQTNGYGCSKDQVKLFKHDSPSAAVFQIFRKTQACEYVKISGLPSSTISVRSYSDAYPRLSRSLRSTVYSARGNPVNVPLMGLPWQLLTITTNTPLANANQTVAVECMTGSFVQILNSELLDIAPSDKYRDLNPTIVSLPLEFGGFSGGVGSLLPYTNNTDAAAGDYGKTRDIAVPQQQGSITLFQAMRRAGIFSDTCKSLSLGTRDENGTDTTFKSQRFEISIKEWDSESWGLSQSLVLPTSIELPKRDKWYLVKLRNYGSTEARISAVCQ